MGHLREIVMQITVKAKIILTIPEIKEKAKETPEDIVLAIEQYLNGLPLFVTSEGREKVGIRVHTGAMEVIH